MVKKKGFSLIELMVGIAIFSILVSMAYPYVLDYIESGKYSAAQTQTASMANDIVRYKFCTGQYPNTLSDLELDNGIYLAGAKIPDTDPWGQRYLYRFDEKKFAVWSGGTNETNDSDAGFNGIKGDDVGSAVN